MIDAKRCLLAGFLVVTGVASAAPVRLVDEPVAKHQKIEDGTILVDFGKVAFGNLRVSLPDGVSGSLKFHFGEAIEAGRVNRKPPGTVRYQVAEVQAAAGKPLVVAPPADQRNTSHPSAVKLPAEFGVLLPFRWVEIEGWQGDFDPNSLVRQSSFLKTWNDDAAHFECSDPLLNRIWDLCKYSIKATTFAGIYVDGDRERIPYEADAYLNQLSHYYCDADKQIARDTYDYLMEKPTWPTEWAPHMVFMAHADWMHTGDAEWIKPRYEALKSKLLLERVGKDGWVMSDKKQVSKDDIVDWPKSERDGYVFKPVNTVVNAFHLKALEKMADLAVAIGNASDAADYRKRHADGAKRFHEQLWMKDKGCYRDGLDTDHASAHATLFPLAFGLVPDDCRAAAVKFLQGRKMACSVYAAQYLMEGLFESGAADVALQLMTADGDRSWKHMVESGTTITWEAWDQKYKPNQDWNHAWGAAPGNLLPRYVLGVEPVVAGWKQLRIAPQIGALTSAKGKVSTVLGAVEVEWKRADLGFNLICVVPDGAQAEVVLPFGGGTLQINGKSVSAQSANDQLRIPLVQAGRHEIHLALKN